MAGMLRPLLLLSSLLVLACGPLAVEPPAEEAPTPENSLLRSSLEAPPSDEVPPPPQPAELERDAPKAPSSEDSSPACKAAKGRREAQERQIYDRRAAVVDSSDERLAQAQASMTLCISDIECATDGKRVMELQDRIAAAEGAYESALTQVGELEAELYAIDAEIKSACGRPGH